MLNRHRKGLVVAALTAVVLLPATQAAGQERGRSAAAPSTARPAAIAKAAPAARPAKSSATRTVKTSFALAGLTPSAKAAARKMATGKLNDPVAESARRAQLSGNNSFYDAAAHAGGISPHRERLGLPTEPDADFAQRCASRSDGPAGYIENRFHWCTNTFATGYVYNGARQSGLFYMDLSFVGYGRDDGDRSMAIFVRPTQVLFVGDDVTEADTVGFGLNCAGRTPGCSTSARQTKTLAEWTADRLLGSWTRFDLSSDETQAEPGYDKASYHEFDPYLTFKGETAPLGVELGGIPATFGVRCDSATYLLRGSRDKACIFSDVVPHLQYAILDEQGQRTNQASVAEHIRQAQDNPDSTWPLRDGPKDIPGKYVGSADGRHLGRIPTVDDPDGQWSKLPYETNVATKDLACLNLRAVDPPPADMPRPQCDEYPFASTWQGAGYASRRESDDPIWDFSVRYVPGAENGSAGTALKNYYRDDRILFQPEDQFWVEILDKAGQTPPAPPRQPSAGPEVAGNEGSPIRLHGTTNQSSDATVSWTIVPGDDVDPGTLCSLDARTTAEPTITCDDDGTFTLTMTVTLPSGATLSASTLVHVYNVAPRVTITSPKRWDHFQVNGANSVDVSIDDPGTHDTHDCLYIWDDHGRTNVVPANDSANRCIAFPAYNAAGMYTIQVFVSDDDGGGASASVMIVMFDPIAGSANIDGSTRGTLTAQPGLPGGTWVNFAAQYNGGGTFPPTGVFKTWIENSNFRLEPTSVEWLVVTPDHQVAARGTGTINGESGYSWLIYGRDNPSRIRTLTWRTGVDPEPQNIVYDTAPGNTQFDIDRLPYQPMTSGAVQIHYW